MDRLTGQQIVLFVIAFVIAGAIASMGTIYILRKVVIVVDPNDPLNRQGGLSPARHYLRLLVEYLSFVGQITNGRRT